MLLELFKIDLDENLVQGQGCIGGCENGCESSCRSGCSGSCTRTPMW